MVRAYAALEACAELSAFEYEQGPLGLHEIDIAVESCGVCHSDVSMLGNEWGTASYPLVPGHEVVGRVAALGRAVTHLKEGDRVGLGWFSSSCMHCHWCMSGDHNLCGSAESTIVQRHGGFSERVRCSAAWAAPLPEAVDAAKAGPLFCGGITVFNPIVQMDVKPTDRVGVIGIGGLGHLALQFLNKWGCEVTAFTSTSAKAEKARALGAHHVVASRDREALGAIAGSLDFVLSTVNVDLSWGPYIAALAPRGRLHLVGAPPSPLKVPAFGLIPGQKAVSGTPMGSPSVLAQMLDFCARHGIAAVTEHFPMSQVNDALAWWQDGKARYRLVLDADF